MRPSGFLHVCLLAALACDGDGPTAPRISQGGAPCTADATMSDGDSGTGCVEVAVRVLTAAGDAVANPLVFAPFTDATPFAQESVHALDGTGRVLLRLRYHGLDSLRTPTRTRMLELRAGMGYSPSQGGYIPPTDRTRLLVEVAKLGSRPYRYSFTIRLAAP